MSNGLIQKAYIVPGQPHFYLAPDKNPGWASLRENFVRIGEEIERSGAELILLYSTQWFSVIGHLFQTDPAPKWLLVDQNWYEYGEIPYEFRIDPEFGTRYCASAKARGMQAATVNYHGFPIDTGTVVALKLLNANNAIPASIVSCNIYAEREETRLLGRIARETIEAYGKKTIVVCVTNLSNRYHTVEIAPGDDRVSSLKDDEWNRKIVEMLGEGRLEDVTEVARQFAREANADMGFKAIWWLGALMGESNQYEGRVWDYQPVWGTGAALVELTPSDKPPEFEKEYDEVAIEAWSASRAGGLDTHNVAEPPPAETKPAAVPKREAPVVASSAPRPVGAYPHARRMGNLLFLSGIGPRNPTTNEVPGTKKNPDGTTASYDIEAQTRAVIANLARILDEAGSSIERIVDVTVFLTDMESDFPTFNRVWAEYFSTIQPTRTTVGVDSLPTPIAIEFKAIAEVD